MILHIHATTMNIMAMEFGMMMNIIGNQFCSRTYFLTFYYFRNIFLFIGRGAKSVTREAKRAAGAATDPLLS